MYYIGIVVMVAGLIGLIFCAKKQRVNPAMQSVAYVFALIMFVGLGMSLYEQMGGGSTADDIENERLFLYSRSAVAGKCLKAGNAGKKVLFVTNPNWDKEEGRKEQVEKQVEAFKSVYGSGDVAIDSIPVPANFDEEGASIEEVMTVKEFTALLAKHPGVQAIVTDIGLPEKAERLFAKKDAPVVFLLSQGNINGKALQRMFKSGKAVGMIGYKNKADYEKRADEDDLIASFDIRYTLIDQNNYTTHQFD